MLPEQTIKKTPNTAEIPPFRKVKSSPGVEPEIVQVSSKFESVDDLRSTTTIEIKPDMLVLSTVADYTAFTFWGMIEWLNSNPLQVHFTICNRSRSSVTLKYDADVITESYNTVEHTLSKIMTVLTYYDDFPPEKLGMVTSTIRYLVNVGTFERPLYKILLPCFVDNMPKDIVYKPTGLPNELDTFDPEPSIKKASFESTLVLDICILLDRAQEPQGKILKPLLNEIKHLSRNNVNLNEIRRAFINNPVVRHCLK